MSNKLYSMLELDHLGFPQNTYYALDMAGVRSDEVEAYFKDGLRNFKSKINCKNIIIRTGLANKPEVKLYTAPELDANDNELIINKMKEALAFFSQRFNGYNDSFIIIEEFNPIEDYLYSLNLVQMNNAYLIEAVKGSHYNLDRDENQPTIIKLNNNGPRIIKSGLNPDDLIILKRQLRQVFNNYFFRDDCVYEFSLLKDRPSFYQIKKPGKLYKQPLAKEEFYNQLKKE